MQGDIDQGMNTTLGQKESANMSTVIDQKNYIEELNRHLK